MPEIDEPDSSPSAAPAGRLRALAFSRPVLLFAFAFAVMADPVSSVAYAIEAALRALDGDLSLLLPTMGLVVAVIGLIIVNYHELIGRFPEGGGAAAAAGSAFGEAWAFIPIGALIVDFVLTIAISVSAASSALIAFASGLAPLRIPLALGILLIVAGLTWFGHVGRAVFATMTTVFVVVAVVVLASGFGTAAARPPIDVAAGHSPLVAVLLAFPVAMALATGVEAPSSAIAQLGQLDDRGRKLFGRVTIWLTLAIVGSLTLGLTALAVHLNVGIPRPDQTQIAEVAKSSVGTHLYTTFQIVTAMLLLAAASSSFQAGPGLLKALARRTGAGGDSTGILPPRLGIVNDHHTPYVAVGVFILAAAAVVSAAGAEDQELVLFYAVSVFLSFLAGLLAMAKFSRREGRRTALWLSLIGGVVVAFTLAINLSRGDPIASLAASLAIAALLYRLWIRAGRPRGIAGAVVEAES
jgi:amino acid transporter